MSLVTKQWTDQGDVTPTLREREEGGVRVVFFFGNREISRNNTHPGAHKKDAAQKLLFEYFMK